MHAWEEGLSKNYGKKSQVRERKSRRLCKCSIQACAALQYVPVLARVGQGGSARWHLTNAYCTKRKQLLHQLSSSPRS